MFNVVHRDIMELRTDRCASQNVTYQETAAIKRLQKKSRFCIKGGGQGEQRGAMAKRDLLTGSLLAT